MCVCAVGGGGNNRNVGLPSNHAYGRPTRKRRQEAASHTWRRKVRRLVMWRGKGSVRVRRVRKTQRDRVKCVRATNHIGTHQPKGKAGMSSTTTLPTNASNAVCAGPVCGRR